MLLKSTLKTLLISALYSELVSADNGGVDVSNMMMFGSGCPDGSVNIISSTDEKTVTVLFSSYYVETTDSKTFDRKSCNIAVPFNIPENKQVALYQLDYRGMFIGNVYFCSLLKRHCFLQIGYTWVPEGDDSETNLGVEYFFAGTKGPIVTRTYTEEEDIFISDKVPLVWSPCGGSEIFRINTSIKAKKGAKDDEDTFITIDSVDGTEDNTIALIYYFSEKEC